MATLENQNIQDTYIGLIKTENNCLLSQQSGRINLTDGNGTCSSISVGKQSDTSGLHVCGPLISSGAAAINGSIDAAGLICTTGKICANGCIDTDQNIIASKGGLFDDISVGRASHGSIDAAGGNRSYETIQLKSNHNLRFFFGTSEKGCLGNSGNFCASGKITTNGICSTDTVAINGQLLAGNATFAGDVNASGGIKAGGDLIAFYSSDKNLKDNLTKIESNNVIDSIDSYEFDWNNKSDREGKGYGFIAQEVQEVLPHLVKESDKGYLGVDYIQFIPLLLKEIKDLKARVSELENN